jgi:hypothetical protein
MQRVVPKAHGANGRFWQRQTGHSANSRCQLSAECVEKSFWLMTQIRIDASFDEGHIVGREFVISGRDTPTLFDLVAEPFDQSCGHDTDAG